MSNVNIFQNSAKTVPTGAKGKNVWQTLIRKPTLAKVDDVTKALAKSLDDAAQKG